VFFTIKLSLGIFIDMVRLYTMKECPFCDDMKKQLTENEVKFVELDINDAKNKVEFTKIKEISNADSIPILLVGKRILVPERSFRTIKEGAEITKKILDGKL